jgi:hypothetical protein
MSFYTPIETLVSYLVPQETPRNSIHQVSEDIESPNALENMMGGKVQCLTTILRSIQTDIQQRTEISKDVIERIYVHYLYVNTKLLEINETPIDSNRALETRRSGLEKQLDTLKLEKRQEQVKCWQDIFKLHQEHRNWYKQYCDLMGRVSLVLPTKGKGVSPMKKF